jgi:peroxiredoxin
LTGFAGLFTDHRRVLCAATRIVAAAEAHTGDGIMRQSKRFTMKSLFAGVSVAVAAVAAAALTPAATAVQQDGAKAPQGVAIGQAAPDFTLKDMKGKEHRLSDYTRQGKIVVLYWWSPDCPYVVKHYPREGIATTNKLVEDFKDKDVVFLAINSAHTGHGYGNRARVQERMEEWKVKYPILVDAEGTIGKQYDAKRTPEMYVICKGGMLRYHGALDNDSSARGIGSLNYVRQALDEILAGSEVSVPTTRAYGCTIKYKS